MKLELTVEEVNMILAALGKQPYEFVFKLIGNIQQQAQLQLQAEPVSTTD
jgi:hypothetical protein